jgi:hypothetical protein
MWRESTSGFSLSQSPPGGGLRLGSAFTQLGKMPPRRSVRRARQETSRILAGYIVTWDVDSGNLLQCTRVRRFIFGHTVSTNGKTYRYPGFVELDGVRYLGQSVLFVDRERLDPLRGFLRANGVEHVISEATMGRILAN